MTQTPPQIPEGYRPALMGGEFMKHNGPLYARLVGERLQMGFRVETRHINPMNNCHGGMLATFADMLLPMVSMYQSEGERRFLPTINLQIDYLSPAPLGCWVQGEGDVLRVTRNMVFVQGLVRADGVLAMRASGIFKQGPLMGDGTNRDPFSLRDWGGPAGA